MFIQSSQTSIFEFFVHKQQQIDKLSIFKVQSTKVLSNLIFPDDWLFSEVNLGSICTLGKWDIGVGESKLDPTSIDNSKVYIQSVVTDSVTSVTLLNYNGIINLI